MILACVNWLPANHRFPHIRFRLPVFNKTKTVKSFSGNLNIWSCRHCCRAKKIRLTSFRLLNRTMKIRFKAIKVN